MPKRKSNAISDATEVVAPRRSTRARASAVAPEKKATSKTASKGSTDGDESKPVPKQSKGRSTKRKVEEDSEIQEAAPSAKKAAKPSKEDKQSGKQGTKTEPAANGSAGGGGDEKQYWLLKAEPETRLENGVDVKFSIDDLAAKTKPEPWDGIRAYPARNNLRAMKKGDLAFFYHSNCKEPAIVGTMEIVEEHSPDLSAHDPKAPYYDASSKPSDPKWSVVHVKFRSKFAVPIGLKELRTYTGTGQPLEHMHMLRQSRLSVSRVSAAEWDYLTALEEEKAREAA